MGDYHGPHQVNPGSKMLKQISTSTITYIHFRTHTKDINVIDRQTVDFEGHPFMICLQLSRVEAELNLFYVSWFHHIICGKHLQVLCICILAFHARKRDINRDKVILK